jgi:hypothetical protein
MQIVEHHRHWTLLVLPDLIDDGGNYRTGVTGSGNIFLDIDSRRP